MDFEAKFLQYQKNVYPQMVEHLAENLGVSVNSINQLEIGFCPGSQSWIWAERDDRGEIVGLLHRYSNGEKRMEEGSKRGLVYECTGSLAKKNVYPRNNFVRAYNAGVDCPVCGKRDWCLISNENISDPQAVICGRTSEGAERHIENAGYLHIRKSSAGIARKRPLLRTSDRAYLIVEGVSDVLAAMDMQYTAIGRPSAEGGIKWVASLLKGQDVIVVGENDDVGRRGMQKTFQTLKANCSSVQKVLPPAQYKDLRAWHPTADEFKLWVDQKADQADLGKVLDSDDPRYLAKKWLDENYQIRGQQTLYCCNQDWYQYTGFHYERISDGQIAANLTAFLADYEFKQAWGKHTECKPLCMTRRFVEDVRFNLRTLCHLESPNNSYQPFYISTKRLLDIERAIVFRNGVYYVDIDKFEVVSPDLFAISPLPYDFQPGLDCALWRSFIFGVFNGDQQSIDLLQEWFGYNLIASNNRESMMFLFGGKAAGKSTTVDVLEAILGEKGYAALDTYDFSSGFGFEPLIGKFSLIVSEDRPVGWAEKAKVLYKIKQITGRDTLNVRRKYKLPINLKPFFKITYVSNELLDFTDESGAFMRRLRCLYYPNCYADNPDWTLKDRLVKEAPGIAIWAIEGLKRLLKNGDFTLPETSKEHLEDVRLLTNPIQAMVSEHCVLKDEFTPTSDLYDLFIAVSKENQSKPMPKPQFEIKFKYAFPKLEKKRIRIAGELKRGYQGIEILSSAYRRYLGKPI